MTNQQLSDALKAKVTDEYVHFWGGPLSSFWHWGFRAHGSWWPTREHYFQAQKCIDPKEEQAIHQAPSPQRAKTLGRQCQCRDNWEQIKYDVMVAAIKAQVASHKTLRELLLKTGDRVLAEDSPYDVVWGFRHGGQSLLGKALMQVRGELRERGYE